jgi:ribosome-binding factor A
LISRELNFEHELLVTIPSVEISPDLKNCNVYVRVIGATYQKSDVIAELEELRISLQRELSKRVVLKYTPHLHFKLDNSIERGNRVLEIIQDLDEPPREE